MVATLWLTGPIEEGGKLLVPFLLLAFGSARFKDPLAGFYLVLVSGATTGAIEGAEWQARAHYRWFHLQLALVRPAAELPHVFVTGFAGAVIWLAAWRRGRAVTAAGAVAFLIAVAIHSVHDGFITLFGVSPSAVAGVDRPLVRSGLPPRISGAVFATGHRHRLLPARPPRRPGADRPGAVGSCPPPWRPQIKTWGCVARADEAPAVAAAPYGRRASTGGSPPGPDRRPRCRSGDPGPRAGTAPVVAVPAATVSRADRAASPTSRLDLRRRTCHPRPRHLRRRRRHRPSGWYVVDGDPRRMRWWDGTGWSHPLRWDGVAWRPA